jgi:hypothetical protein
MISFDQFFPLDYITPPPKVQYTEKSARETGIIINSPIRITPFLGRIVLFYEVRNYLLSLMAAVVLTAKEGNLCLLKNVS